MINNIEGFKNEVSNRVLFEIRNKLKLYGNQYVKSSKKKSWFKTYVKLHKIRVIVTNNKEINDICIEWFLDPDSVFYHCGNKSSLQTMLDGLNGKINNEKKIRLKIKKTNIGETHKDRYKLYIKSVKWKNFKKGIIETRGNKCEKCGNTDCILDGHHITYKRLFNELPEDILLVCRKCHKNIHKG